MILERVRTTPEPRQRNTMQQFSMKRQHDVEGRKSEKNEEQWKQKAIVVGKKMRKGKGEENSIDKRGLFEGMGEGKPWRYSTKKNKEVTCHK
jgi:hypothetical protein